MAKCAADLFCADWLMEFPAGLVVLQFGPTLRQRPLLAESRPLIIC